jgi:hypothetical protein
MDGRNKGERNKGERNKGERNKGERNKGERNKGERNKGERKLYFLDRDDLVYISDGISSLLDCSSN